MVSSRVVLTKEINPINLKGKINSTKFKLNAGAHPQKELQEDWTENCEGGFEIKVLEQLEYDKDESKTDYSDDLALLKMIWIDKLTKEGVLLYQLVQKRLLRL